MDIYTHLWVVVLPDGGRPWVVTPESGDGPVKGPEFSFVESRTAGDLVIVQTSKAGESIVSHFGVIVMASAVCIRWIASSSAGPTAMMILTTCRPTTTTISKTKEKETKKKSQKWHQNI